MSPGPTVTPRQLLAKMVQGDEAFERVRLLEGWTLRQFRAELSRAPLPEARQAGMTDAQLMAALGAASMPGEGRFFPDTYLYSRGVSDLTVLKRALRHDATPARCRLGVASRRLAVEVRR